MDGFNRRVATGKVHWYPGKSAKKKNSHNKSRREKSIGDTSRGTMRHRR